MLGRTTITGTRLSRYNKYMAIKHTYRILTEEDFNPEENAELERLAQEAERGYTLPDIPSDSAGSGSLGPVRPIKVENLEVNL